MNFDAPRTKMNRKTFVVDSRNCAKMDNEGPLKSHLKRLIKEIKSEVHCWLVEKGFIKVVIDDYYVID